MKLPFGKETLPQPTTLGLRPSFGFGDRLGLATPGHIDAIRGSRFLPIFAQQSIREMQRTGRQPDEVMRAAQQAVAEAGWDADWGADADHLKTEEDVQRTAAAGFTFFTIDPSEHVNNHADSMPAEHLNQGVKEFITESGLFEGLQELYDLYLGREHDLGDGRVLGFTDDDEPALWRAVVKYGFAVAHAERMAGWIRAANVGRQVEIEISVDETETPTSPLEHLFVGLELKRRGVNVVSLAPRFIGEFEKGIDYKGDLAAFEESLAEHVAIARYCGPYKLSVHSGSDKFSIYPILGRVCGDLLHIKTAGTSYLEALRVVARVKPKLFREIIDFARERFDTDRATYHISAHLGEIAPPAELSEEEREQVYLDRDDGRQVLHVTFGSVLSQGRAANGRAFKDAIRKVLGEQADLHRELVGAHLGKHVELLEQG